MGELRIFRVVMVSGFLLFALKVMDLATGGDAFLPKAVAAAEPAPKEAGEQKDEAGAPEDKPAEHRDEAKKGEAKADDAHKSQAESHGDVAAEQGAADAHKADAATDPADLSRAEIELLQNLSARRVELDARARELDMREKLLEASEKRVGERIAELKGIESNIQALLGTRDQAEEEKLASLVKVYESMKPKDAARIFEQLDMEVLLPVANRMKEAKIGAVLAQMAPEAAQRLTVNMAHRMEAPKAAAPAAGKAG